MFVSGVNSAMSAVRNFTGRVARIPVIGTPVVGAAAVTGGVGLLSGLSKIWTAVSSSMVPSTSLGVFFTPIKEFFGHALAPVGEVLGIPMLGPITAASTITVGAIGGALYSFFKAPQMKEKAMLEAIRLASKRAPSEAAAASLSRIV